MLSLRDEDSCVHSRTLARNADILRNTARRD